MMKRILLGLLCASMSLCAVAQNRVTKVLIHPVREVCLLQKFKCPKIREQENAL